MPHYPYLIVGGGMTADAAVRGILDVDPKAAIGLIGAEPHAPYNRPPLSKGLWKGKPLDSVWRATPAGLVTLHLGRTVTGLDPGARQVHDDRGQTYTYDKLLLATGGTPRRLPFGEGEIIYFRTLDDYQRLRQLADAGGRFAVIGGGFIGSEIAAALRMVGREVAHIFPEAGIGARLFPDGLAGFLSDYYHQRGIEVRSGSTVIGLEPKSGRLAVRVRRMQPAVEETIVVDGVVAGLGLQPNIDLARQAGLQVGDGIVVDEFLRTSRPGIYAAGDVAEFPSPVLGMRRRVEHEDNALTMGKAAGRAMASAETPYRHLPFFYSDLFDLGYEAVGEVDSRLEVVADWQEPYRKGVVYYLGGGRVRGVLLWNVWDQVEAARQLIAEPGPFEPEALKGRLPR